MSSILKALKKLEDDKTTRRPDELKLNTEILRIDNSPIFSTTVILLFSLLLLAGGSGATYIFLKFDRASGLANLKPLEINRQNQPIVSVTSDIKTERLPAIVETKPVNLQKLQKKTTMTAPSDSSFKTTKQAVTSKSVNMLKTSKSSSSLLSESVKAIPALRVNGIAFQDGTAENVAIVNGVMVSIGSVVDGVIIEGVYKNRVGFSYNGEKFEIRLGQSNR
jgi:general secretion pathway protein B